MMAMIEQPEVEVFKYLGNKINFTETAINTYRLYFNYTGSNGSLSAYIKNYECYNCEAESISISSPIDLSAKYSNQLIIKREYPNEKELCYFTPEVGEFGVYQLHIDDHSCTLETLLEPVNIYLPIFTVILIYLLVSACLYGLFYVLDKKILKRKNEDSEEPKKQRIQSLDTFRGISIVVMILVNYGGGGYNFMEHAIWNGLQVADLVFPWFLWIMGVCIPLSIRSSLKQNSKWFIFLNILKRSILLFLIGLCLNGTGFAPYNTFFSDIYYIRIFGVLQRFGLCYFFVASMHLIFAKKENPQSNLKICLDTYMLLPQWIIILVIFVIHTVCIFVVKVPDCPVVGYLGPGGTMHINMTYVNCTGGTTGYIDNYILGQDHMYVSMPLREIYGVGTAFEPEGFFGTLTAIVQVFLGVQAGVILQAYKSHKKRLATWVIWGVATGIIGGGLCGFSKNEGIIPINKNLWSISFVLATTSLAFFLLSILYAIIDMKKRWSGKPFLFAGMNAIVMYVGHTLSFRLFPFQWGTVYPNLHFQLLSQAVWGTMMWVLVSYWMYRIKFFLSI